MRRPALCLFAVVNAGLLLSPTSGRAEDKPAKPAFKLPKDPKAVVISFDWKGGFTPPRKNMAPVLSILADGTLLMPDRFGMAKDVTGKITRKELQDLLRFAITENKFFKFDAAKVKEKVRKASAGRPRIAIADAPSSVVEIKLAGKSHKASYYALGFAARQYKTVAELQQLYAIQQRLNRLMNVTRLGGKKEVAKMLVLANVHLKKKFPKAAPLTASDLQSAGVRRDGSKYVSFSRYGKRADGKPDGTYANVFIQIKGDTEPKVTVRAKLQ